MRAAALRISAAAVSKFQVHSPLLSGTFCSDSLTDLRNRVAFLTEKPSAAAVNEKPYTADLHSDIRALADALLCAPDAAAPLILDSHSAAALLRRSRNAPLALLSLLSARPLLAISVLRWRCGRADPRDSIQPEEFAKAIALAGRSKDPDLAVELFTTAKDAAACTTSVYNSLMAAYARAGVGRRAIPVFEDLKNDPKCQSSVVSYNILLSILGRTMLVHRIEEILSTMEPLGVPPNINTYNIALAAYITAWMWDQMEVTFHRMEAGKVKPDNHTHLLMLRGYAHAVNIEKMEEFYERVKDQVDCGLIGAMICAYCKSSHPNRITNVERLSKLMPEDVYRPWLNVLLIRLYAQEGLVESMERFISEAFMRNTIVTTKGVMRSIISGYFRDNAVDRLARFIEQAANAGWTLCRSLFHCKMVMYGKESRLAEMHGVLDEMDVFHFCRTKKTFLIMYKAYWDIGRRLEAQTVIGMMWKHGFDDPLDAFAL